VVVCEVRGPARLELATRTRSGLAVARGKYRT